MATERKSPKRLLIDIDEETHYEVRRRALEKNITLRRWVLQAIADKIKREQQYEEK